VRLRSSAHEAAWANKSNTSEMGNSGAYAGNHQEATGSQLKENQSLKCKVVKKSGRAASTTQLCMKVRILILDALMDKQPMQGVRMTVGIQAHTRCLAYKLTGGNEARL